MPTYEYQCEACGCHFERVMNMSDESVKVCPQCGGSVRRLMSTGTGFILKNSGSHHSGHHHKEPGGQCSLETSGKTCCGRDERCGHSSCGE
jgi:putative FmdB family regulatory protein